MYMNIKIEARLQLKIRTNWLTQKYQIYVNKKIEARLQ